MLASAAGVPLVIRILTNPAFLVCIVAIESVTTTLKSENIIDDGDITSPLVDNRMSETTTSPPAVCPSDTLISPVTESVMISPGDPTYSLIFP